jgi:beta-glucosidase
VPVERLGIPAIKVTDGPIGARGSMQHGGPASACFPSGSALAATWNTELVHRVGQALGEETKTKGAHVLLAPTVNIHRSPLAGRNFEAYSEDPYLTGRMATAYVSGVQSWGVGACIKHFVCNDSEFERTTISSEVAERPLREIYLTPFRMAIRDGKPWAVMSAYNKVNGTWCSQNRRLLRDVLKGEWGFDGIVMSDWAGTYDVAAAAAGLDLEMPGPPRFMDHKVLEELEAGELREDELDDKVRRLLRTIARSGAFDDPEDRPELAVDKLEHRAVAREAAGEAIVLLKNSNSILPLDPAKLGTLAVIGANARWAQPFGGGSVRVNPHYVVTPLDGIRARVGDDCTVEYEAGCAIHRMPPVVDPAWLTSGEADPDGGPQHGLALEYFGTPDLSGEPVHRAVSSSTQFFWSGYTLPHVDADRFSVRATGTLVPPESGTFAFGLASTGTSRLYVDEELIIENDDASQEHRQATAEVELAAGRPYQLRLEYVWTGEGAWRRLYLGCAPTLPRGSMERAVSLAARADAAVVVVGLTPEWESEGFDRVDMDLPGPQNELIERVAAANPNTIVVLNAGSPVRMDWLDEAAAVVQAWYLGQETGNAIADVLFGDVNPSGKLPTGFPRRLQDNPAYANYPGENGRVHYREGIFVGYRHYDRKGIEPLFPFGYGLSYTTFAYSEIELSGEEIEPGQELQVQVAVQNTGTRTGKEIVQLYVRDVSSSLVRPEKELKAFAKVALEPGETKTVTLALDQQALSFYDPGRAQWIAEPGEFEVLVGSSSADIHLRRTFRLMESA